MSKNDLRKWSSSLLLLIGTLVLGLVVKQFDSVALSGDIQDSSWFTLVNLNHNAFHSWRLEPISRLCDELFPQLNFKERPIPGIVTLLIGTILFFRASDGVRATWSPIFALGTPLVVFFTLITIGLDPLVFGAISWVPFLAVVSKKALNSAGSPLLLSILALVSIENAFSANQTSLVGSACALWIAYLMAKSNPLGVRNLNLVSLIIIVPAIYTTLTCPMAEAPKYPTSAHVIQYDGSQGNIRPLIGPAYPFESIDRAGMRREYGDRSLALLTISVFSWWVRRRHQTSVARYTAKVAMVMALLATLNAILPESIALISPLPSLSRLIPWGTTYSITSVALGLSAWMTGTTLLLNMRHFSFIPLFITLTVILLFCSPNIVQPILRKGGLISDPELRALILSPSATIFRSLVSTGTDVKNWIDNVKAVTKIRARDCIDLGAKIKISPAPSPQVLDAAKLSETHWRWSTRTGTQRGDEVLTIQFNNPIEIRGLELDPGSYFTDYPRGLKITGGSCDSSTTLAEIANYPVWQGALKVTYRGLPYYTPRNDVRIVFSAPQTVQCLFVQQTGQAPFDWSISRVRVL